MTLPISETRWFPPLHVVKFVLAVALAAATARAVHSQQPMPGQTPPAPPIQTPTAQPPQTQPAPQPSASPATSPAAPVSSPTTPAPTALPPASLITQTPMQTGGALSLDEAIRLAGVAASDFTQAQLNERIAAEDVRQAQAAF